MPVLDILSGSTKPLDRACSGAKCGDLEEAGFPVKRTGGKDHVTIELPKPVQKSDADKLNNTFGRGKE